MVDVAIIGCGVTGAAVAHLLAQYNVQVLVLEKENDVAMGTTRANSAIIHAGYDPAPGTRMARLNVRGNALVQSQCKDLHVLCKNTGSLVLAFTEEDQKHIEMLYARGEANGVPHQRLLTKEETLAMEPNVAPEVCGALYAPTACIIDPWDYCLALAQVAQMNGVQFRFEAPVQRMEKTEDGWRLFTPQGTFEAHYVVDAAGVFADEVAALTGIAPGFATQPVKGEYFVLDKSQGTLVNHVIFQCPNATGKGVLVAPTVHGNLLAGPDALGTTRTDVSTDAAGLADVRTRALHSVPGINFRENIRNFAGIRANSDTDDFCIGTTAPRFVTLGGIKSPGLSSAPAIAEECLALLEKEGLAATKKEQFNPVREHKVFHLMNEEEKKAAIAENPLYGRVICRCETITEGEIVAALHAPLPPHTVDGVKRRCGAGMGRCQGGFCGPRVHEILARELHLDPVSILKDGAGSNILVGETKGGAAHE